MLYFKEVKTESFKDFCEGINALKDSNYRILSVAIDRRGGYIKNIRKLLGKIPIQMCLFYQKAIIRRYIADQPRSSFSKDLKPINALGYVNQNLIKNSLISFIDSKINIIIF